MPAIEVCIEMRVSELSQLLTIMMLLAHILKALPSTFLQVKTFVMRAYKCAFSYLRLIPSASVTFLIH